MTLKVRRVVTGHDEQGRARVQIDDVSTHLSSSRPGHSSGLIWTTEGFPVDNDGHSDEADRPVRTTLPNGTVFRVIEYQPGVAARNHRTDSIDYAVIVSGEIDMQLDDETVHLKAGDVVVQRGTIHNWVNNSSGPCVIAFVLIDAKPVSVNGKTLEATG